MKGVLVLKGLRRRYKQVSEVWRDGSGGVKVQGLSAFSSRDALISMFFCCCVKVTCLSVLSRVLCVFQVRFIIGGMVVLYPQEDESSGVVGW